MSSTKDDPAIRPGASRRLKAVLVAYMVIVSILVIVTLATEGFGKSAVGPIGGLIIGLIASFRIWGTSSRDLRA